MLQINSLGIKPQILTILQQQGDLSPQELLLQLEKYKYVNREEIINMLVNYYTTEQQITMSKSIVSLDRISAMSESEQCLCATHQFLINHDGSEIQIIRPIEQTENLQSIYLQMKYTDPKELFVTPFNFEQLRNQNITYAPLSVFNRLVYECYLLGATDLHFDVSHANGVTYPVTYRKGWGPLIPLDLFTLDAKMNNDILYELIDSRTTSNGADVSTLAGVQSSINDLFGDGTIALRITGNACVDGYEYVCRILPKTVSYKTIDQLGLKLPVAQKLHSLACKSNGLTLVTGAKCTGKSTTLRAVVAEMALSHRKILEYSSPVEVNMDFTQIDYSNNVDFLSSLTRLAKKQDVDIVFMSEIPNREVAFAVMELVNASIHTLTTMHINRLWHLPYKLNELYGDAYKNLITQINGVVNQKAFVKLCPYCRKQRLINDYSNKQIGNLLKQYNVTNYYEASGCEHCNNTGIMPNSYTPYAECLIFDDSLRSDLLQCIHPFEMEDVLKKRMKQDFCYFEYILACDVQAGILSPDVVQDIL